MRAKALLCALISFLVPMVVCAQTSDDALVRELYAKSGMEKQLRDLPLVIQAALEREAREDDDVQKLPANVRSAIQESAKKAFSPESMKKSILPELREKLTDREIKIILEWLDSPLGKKCTQLEENASTAEAMAEMEHYATQMRSNPPAAGRLNVLRQLDSATKMTESAVEMAINTQVAVTLAIMATFPRELHKSFDDVAREIEENRSKIESEVRSETLVSLLYTYRSLTEAEIKRYTQFAASPAGEKFNTVSISAFKKAFLDSSIRWGRGIGEEMQQMSNRTDA
ncbi:MAG: DUF2059 domain-containing protein [Syntrophobacteraceae bacterium]